MNAIKSDIRGPDEGILECFAFPPMLPERIKSTIDEEAQAELQDLFEGALASGNSDLTAIPEVMKLREWAYFREVGQVCAYVDRTLPELLVNRAVVADLEKFISVVEELVVGHYYETPENIASGVTLQDQLYFLKDLAFYGKYPQVFEITEDVTRAANPNPLDVRYSSTGLYRMYAEALTGIGLEIVDGGSVLLARLQPNIKYSSSRAGKTMFNRELQSQIAEVSEIMGLPKEPAPPKEDFIGNRDQALLQLNTLLTIYPEVPLVLVLKQEFIQIMQSKRDTFRCRLFFDRAEELNRACIILQKHLAAHPDSARPTTDELRLRVVHHACDAFIFSIPDEKRVSANPAEDVAGFLRPNKLLGYNRGVYVAVHTTVPLTLNGQAVNMEIQMYPACEIALVPLMHSSYIHAGELSLKDRGLSPFLNTAMKHTEDGIDLFMGKE